MKQNKNLKHKCSAQVQMAIALGSETGSADYMVCDCRPFFPDDRWGKKGGGLGTDLWCQKDLLDGALVPWGAWARAEWLLGVVSFW